MEAPGLEGEPLFKRGNARLEELGIEPMGHSDVRFTLSVYAKAVKRRSKLSGAYLAEFERAFAWAAPPTSEEALTGTDAQSETEEATRA